MRLFSTALLLAAGIAACGILNSDKKSEVAPKAFELPQYASKVIASNNNFGIDLFTGVAVEEDQNFMISPLSASIALTMLMNGAEEETFDQLRDMLGYDANLSVEEINVLYNSLVKQLLEADKKVTLSIANAIFSRKDFQIKQPFTDRMRKDFKAEVKALDFEDASSVDYINKWASDNTNKKIPRVIEGLSRELVMLLMNALYFKGDWTNQFDKSMTTDKPFYMVDGSQKGVPTMTGKVNTIRHFDTDYMAVELPYGRKNFSMVIIQPENLSDFYQSFDGQKWGFISTALDEQSVWHETDLSMPRFKFEYEKFLDDQLKSMGMTNAYSPQLANFSEITDLPVSVSFVKQNTFIEVNEEGTEAAAVTTIGVELTSGGSRTLHINKPFIFVIRERTTNTILFMGSVLDPSV